MLNSAQCVKNKGVIVFIFLQVHILSLLEQDKFENFNCILQAYLESFSYPLVHR